MIVQFKQLHSFPWCECSGRHFCLKCHITSAEAKICPADRQEAPKRRSLESLAEDLDRFTNAGANIENAKLHNNNVIAPPFFDIPLDQARTFVKYMSYERCIFLTTQCFKNKTHISTVTMRTIQPISLLIYMFSWCVCDVS